MTVVLLILFVQDEVQAAIEKIRAGRTPEKLSELRDPRVLDAIAEQVRSGKPFTEPVALHLCAHGGRPHADAFLALLDHRTVKVAWAAVFALAACLDAKLLPLLDPKLDGGRDVQVRALSVLAEARLEPAAPLVEKRLALLDPADRERSKAMLRAVAACRARGAHDALMAYYEKTDDDLVVRAFGRVWEMRLDATPLGRTDEIRRLTALVVIRRLALGGATKDLYCDAMLRLFTKEEFERFLRDFAGESFFARRVVAVAALRRSFDRAKGVRVAEALLANPDAGLVGLVLVRSPWELPKDRLATLLDRRDDVKIDDAPPQARVCDLAAWRLALQIDRKETEVPSALEKRDALVREWKARLAK